MLCMAFFVLDIIKVPIAESSAVSTHVSNYNSNSQMTHTLLQCQYSVVRWLIAYTIQLKGRSRNFYDDHTTSLEPEATANTTNPRSSVSSESGVPKDDPTSPTLSMSSDSGDSSLRQLGNLCRAADIVRSVLYSTPDNVLTIHEIFRQVNHFFFFFRLLLFNSNYLILFVYARSLNVFKFKRWPLVVNKLGSASGLFSSRMHVILNPSQ